MTRALLGTLSLIVFLRVLGVFLVLVGFLDHWATLGGSAATAGAGFGAYALALALFLLPLGALSDRVGRRGVIVGALLVSALGGLLAAFATSAWAFALGRFVQGMGAVNGVALAVAGEAGEPETRTRRMAALGAAAGGGVVAGLLMSAFLHRAGVGIPALLVAFSALTLLTVPLAWRHVPAAAPPPAREPQRWGVALLLGGGAFAVNFSLAGLLLFSPVLVRQAAPGIAYEVALLLMLLPAGLGMFAAARMADQGRARLVGVVAALLLGAAPLAFLGQPGAVPLVLAGVLFFLGHSSLTSLLPSLAARLAPTGRRGLAQGLQSTLQYLGSAAGAALVGVLFAAGATAAMGAAFLAAGLAVALVVVLATPAFPSPGSGEPLS